MSHLRNYLFLFFISLSHLLSAQEICTNGIDDDGDGLIDLNDPDCVCNGVTPASFVSNPSFETITCCPATYGDFPCEGPGNWYPTSGSPDLFNTCDWTHFMGQVGLLPFPDGNGAAGIFAATNYREHIGACLTNTLVAGTPYTFQFTMASTGKTINPNNGENEPCTLNFTPDTVVMELYGHPNCGNFPFASSGCPPALVPGYVLLGSASVSQNTPGYQTVTINFTPVTNINEIVIGYACNLPAGWPSLTDIQALGACTPYAVLDNFIMNTTASFSGVSISAQGDICSNDLTLIANVAQPGSFQWYSGGVALAGQTANNLDVSGMNLPTGMYQVFYDSGTDCGIDSFFVDNTPSSSLNANNATICEGDTAVLTASGALGYSWFSMDGNMISPSETALLSPAVTTNYFVVGNMANGCLDTLTSLVTVAPIPNDVDVSVSPIPVETEVTISLSNPAYAYTWTAPDSSISNGNTLSYTFPAGDGVYEFLVTAQNADGCIYNYTVPIDINSDLLVYVPNAFTPDENEFNDIFKPVISDKMNKDSYVFKIYNRWGQLLFESRNAEIGWDGTYQNKKVPSGAYTWTIDFEVINVDEPRQYNGHVNLLR